MSVRNLWKVTGEMMISKGEKTKLVKEEFLIEAEGLTDVEVSGLELLKTLTTFPESIAIVKAEQFKAECLLMSESNIVSEEMLAGKFLWEFGEEGEPKWYAVAVDFFTLDEKECEMKKASTSNFLVAAETVAGAYNEVVFELKEYMVESKISAIKPIKTEFVLLSKTTHEACVYHYDTYTTNKK